MDVLKDKRPDTGLHDIQKLAAEHKAKQEAQEAEERRRDITPMGVVVPPVVGVPVHRVRHTPRWVFLAGGGAFLAIAGAVGVGYAVRTATGPQVASAAVLPRVESPRVTLPRVEQMPVVESVPAPAPAAAAVKPEPHKAVARVERPARTEKVEKAAPRAEPKAQPKAAEKPAAPAPAAVARTPKDELDQLLAEGTADDARKAAAGPAATDDRGLPEAPSSEAISAAMNKVKGRVQGCYDKYQQTGIVNVQLSIAKTGKVSGIDVSGKFAGTDTGTCVAAAVKSATFPRFKGATLNIDYPFLLQQQ